MFENNGRFKIPAASPLAVAVNNNILSIFAPTPLLEIL